MVERGVECIADIRKRYDGERRNPWDEAECGHHYARAMAAWSGVLALSGFRYSAPERQVIAAPRGRTPFRSFWSAGPGWGAFALSPRRFSLSVVEGALPVRRVEVASAVQPARVTIAGAAAAHDVSRRDDRVIVTLREDATIPAGKELVIEACVANM